ncbi:hypothetical protein EJ110_NYTH19281 [Nymphaea thermarum]|nr:hypothetical protein EJ110_NYTH19281 [Nymphaea thermarum]
MFYLVSLLLQVSQNVETVKSRGSGYVTMGSRDEAKAALSALDNYGTRNCNLEMDFSHIKPFSVTPKSICLFSMNSIVTNHELLVQHAQWHEDPYAEKNNSSSSNVPGDDEQASSSYRGLALPIGQSELHLQSRQQHVYETLQGSHPPSATTKTSCAQSSW